MTQILPKGKKRKRATPLWRHKWFKGGLVGVMLIGVACSGWWLVSSGTFKNMVDVVKWQAIALSSQAGLKIDEVLVVGRSNTDRTVLFNALGMTRGAPILAFDVESARTRVEKLPWIRHASVERLFPGTILLSVEERAPIALWQYKGQFSLIDYEGHVILNEGLGQYSDYMVVVGEDAPQHTATLMEILGSQPELMSLVRAAVRVGGRRWNIRLVGDIDVQLPEQDAPSAWLRLAKYQRTHSVLDRDIVLVDLRLPDRMIIRRSPVQESIQLNLGQET